MAERATISVAGVPTAIGKAPKPTMLFPPRPPKGEGWSFYNFDDLNFGMITKVERKTLRPRPFGGESGPQPALSPAGAGRVRGSPPCREDEPRSLLQSVRPKRHFTRC